MAVNRFALNKSSLVIEIASNDGHLLRLFDRQKIPCIGIEPTDSTASYAESKGSNVIKGFFDKSLAKRLARNQQQADLVVANNVLAHVPDVKDFAEGVSKLIKRNGVLSIEFPHFLNLLKFKQFDTVYHEHYSYLTLRFIITLLKNCGMRVFSCEELTTHGGSLRVLACKNNADHETEQSVGMVLETEIQFGLFDTETYNSVQPDANTIKNDFIKFLIGEKTKGRKVAGFGAAAKGNTLLNYSGIRSDLVAFVCDNAKSKQHKFCPGSKIPIVPPEIISEKQPDTIIVFTWNIFDEIKIAIRNYIKKPTKLVVAVPRIEEFVIQPLK